MLRFCAAAVFAAATITSSLSADAETETALSPEADLVFWTCPLGVVFEASPPMDSELEAHSCIRKVISSGQVYLPAGKIIDSQTGETEHQLPLTLSNCQSNAQAFILEWLKDYWDPRLEGHRIAKWSCTKAKDFNDLEI